MDTTHESIYSYVQELFRRGIVIIVGSGASSSYGLPGMGDLASHLIATVPEQVLHLSGESQIEWERISNELAADAGLETALASGPVSESLLALITDQIARCIQQSEQVAIATILSAPGLSGFGRLFEHILKTAPVADVITTNYDRLIEVHAARASVRVDSMYYGHTVGRLDATLSREELFRAQTVPGRPLATSLAPRPHVRLSKPHGSLDWFTHEDQHFRSDLVVPGARRIIAPGGDKYRLGYEAPFDAHRARANDSIDAASALLFVGYGFNDEHLQTHLRPRFPNVPAVILSRSLTPNAREYLGLNPTSIGIESAADPGRCRVFQGSSVLELDTPLWNLEHLAKDVLSI